MASPSSLKGTLGDRYRCTVPKNAVDWRRNQTGVVSPVRDQSVSSSGCDKVRLCLCFLLNCCLQACNWNQTLRASVNVSPCIATSCTGMSTRHCILCTRTALLQYMCRLHAMVTVFLFAHACHTGAHDDADCQNVLSTFCQPKASCTCCR